MQIRGRQDGNRDGPGLGRGEAGNQDQTSKRTEHGIFRIK